MSVSSHRVVRPEIRLYPIGSRDGFELVAPRLVVAGYTGRDRAAVARHVEELAGLGIAPPASTPTFYELDADLLSTEAVVTVHGAATSGEVEPVLIRHAGKYFLGVGSDHTDREVERDSVAAAKAACPKPLSCEIVPLSLFPDPSGTQPGWDAITAGSDVDGNPYQRGTLSALRTPPDLLARLAKAVGDGGDDLVVFAGTVPLLGGQFEYGTHWRCALTCGPHVRLRHSYDVKRAGS